MDYTSLADAIVTWMKDYAERAGADGYVVGLSGGIDSAVTAALAVRAVGAEHVLGVLLPCHSQLEDAAFAQMVADALGLQPITIDLSAAYDALAASLPEGSEMARANVKPRLRMTTLYYLAQSRNCLVAGTGNCPEMMVGYFTKYGDGGVDIEPLGELYKREVRALARVLGVPEPVITRPPTAGLWPGQTDEGELGITYDELDAILAAMAVGCEPDAPAATVVRVQRMIAASAHKRVLPPIFPVKRGS
jgi:NAD+ synthase